MVGKSERLDPLLYLRVLQAIDHKYPPEERGDLLVFLSGVAEIGAVLEVAQAYAARTQHWIVLPQHSTLSVVKQDKLFDVPPPGVRKCILSTNVAETSVTIDGMHFILDSGKVKEMSYDPQDKLQHLQEFWISQASAEQWKGCAGRTGPGICYRLYAESDYDAFSPYPVPEIQQVALDALVLQLKSMGLGDSRTFPFLEPPPSSSLEMAVWYLKDQGALDEAEDLMPIRNLLAQLPMDVVVDESFFETTSCWRKPPASPATATAGRADTRNAVSCTGCGVPTRRWKVGSVRCCGCRTEQTPLPVRRTTTVAPMRRESAALISLHPSPLPRGRIGPCRPLTPSLSPQDVKFKLHPNVDKLQAVSSSVLSSQLTLLKLVLCRGLYPQLAMPDQFNSGRKDSDQIFHTKNKQGVVFHPTCVFATSPELLHTKEGPERGGIKDPTEGLSHHHQLLAFVLLLETNKPYLVNCVQVPALRALLLFSRSLDTSADCAWLVVDGWLEITIPNADSALRLLSTALQLRSAWKNLLHQLLEGRGDESGRRPSSQDVSVLSQGLLEFLQTEVTWPCRTSCASSPGWRNRTSTSVPKLWLLLPGFFQGTEMKPDEVKGGHRVMTDFLTYNCLATDMDLYSDCLRSFWTCPHCDLHMPFTTPPRSACATKVLAGPPRPPLEEAAEHSSKTSALHRSYHCNICQQDFTFTPTEILRHKKQHR